MAGLPKITVPDFLKQLWGVLRGQVHQWLHPRHDVIMGLKKNKLQVVGCRNCNKIYYVKKGA